MIATATLVIAAAALAACAAIGAAVTLRFTADRRHQLPPFQGEALQVSFPARDGRARIDGWYLAPPVPAGGPAVVLLLGRDAHRVGGPKTPGAGPAQALAARGVAVLTIDLRGHGTGTRNTDGERERFGVLGAVDWLRGRGHHRIDVRGASLGMTSARMAGLTISHMDLLARAV